MYLLFDIGGSKMRVAAVSDLSARPASPQLAATPKDAAAGLEELLRLANGLVGDRPLSGIAGGVAGTFDQERQILVNAPNLSGWSGTPLVNRLAGQFNCPVFLENDTALVGLGEAWHGAGRKEGIMAYMTVSTGVGGARIVDGRIDRTVYGFEPGHQIVNFNEPAVSLEDRIAGPAIARRLGRHPSEITDPAVWDEAASLLAIGLYNTILHWSPELVVLGGSMFKSPGISLGAVRQRLARLKPIFPSWPELKNGSLGDWGGLYGALVYLRQKLF